MEPSNYSKSLARCISFAAELFADDPRFNQDVEVRHRDGSMWYIRCGFWMLDPDDDRYAWVITEHFREMVFEVGDIEAKVFPAGPPRTYRAGGCTR